jgi:hypothetical protein
MPKFDKTAQHRRNATHGAGAGAQALQMDRAHTRGSAQHASANRFAKAETGETLRRQAGWGPRDGELRAPRACCHLVASATDGPSKRRVPAIFDDFTTCTCMPQTIVQVSVPQNTQNATGDSRGGKKKTLGGSVEISSSPTSSTSTPCRRPSADICGFTYSCQEPPRSIIAIPSPPDRVAHPSPSALRLIFGFPRAGLGGSARSHYLCWRIQRPGENLPPMVIHTQAHRSIISP